MSNLISSLSYVTATNIDGGFQTSRDDSKRRGSQQNAEGVKEQTFVNATMCG